MINCIFYDKVNLGRQIYYMIILYNRYNSKKCKNSNNIQLSAKNKNTFMKQRINKPITRSRKRLPVIQDKQPQTRIQQSDNEDDPEVQHSNSQLSLTLSTGYQPKQILCRDYEKEIITKFIKQCLASEGKQNSRVLYISGVPGVGKTVTTMQIINRIKKTINYRKAIFKYINAITLSSPTQIYKCINEQIYKPLKNDISKNPPVNLTLKFIEDKRIKFIIIDQIDYLLTKNQNILYNIFQWCNSPQTKLCSIVIANTMDFPQKLQPKISSRMGQNRLVYKPYSQAEVQKIIEDRLMKSNRFTKQSIVYSCKKMASFTSDVRKLLDVLRSTIQEKSQGTITTEDIAKCWRRAAQQLGQIWQESLPEFYRKMLNVIKDHGGVSTDLKLVQRFSFMQKYTHSEILIGAKQMQQMGLVRIKQKKQKYMRIYEITVLKI